jgi:N-acetylmuramoyl-L-alanine amidase
MAIPYTYSDWPTPNQDDRPDDVAAIDMLVLHYTGMRSARDALERMRDAAFKVSAHWCIDEDGRIYRLVPEEMRAWHAGLSYWRGRHLVNDSSIGIELVNPGHEFGYRPFPPAQMDALIALAGDIIARHGIPAANVVGHSDVAPLRKQDPGELFDWARLARHGIGLWPRAGEPAPEPPALGLGARGTEVRRLQENLFDFGYGLSSDGHFGEESESIVTAFQRHFRQARVDGIADGATRSILDNLLAQSGGAS